MSSTTRATRTLTALVVAATFGLAACGGSDEAETPAGASTPATAAESTPDTAPPVSEPAASEPAVSEPAVSEPTPAQATTATKGDAFCVLAAEVDALGNKLTAEGFEDPAVLQTNLAAALAAGNEAAVVAPADIKPIVDDVIATQQELSDRLVEFDFDFVAAYADEEFQAFIEGVETDTKSDTLEEYLESKCGIAADASSPDSSEPVNDESDGLDLPEGEAGVEAFVRFAMIGNDIEVDPEQVACTTDKLIESGFTAEKLEGLTGAVDDPALDASFEAIGQAFIDCNVPIPLGS